MTNTICEASYCFICNMFYFPEDFDNANYADNSTPYYADNSVEADVNNLEQSSTILFECLNNIYMKVNTGKSYGYDWQ